jgi:hypothetical protein
MSQLAQLRVGDSYAVARWTARKRVDGPPDEVLELLTEPNAISRWAPIDFTVIDWDGERLAAGERVRVRGSLAGRSLDFVVDVTEADDGRLELTATGPIRLDVAYQALARADGTDVHASITVSGNGLLGGLLARATDALLAAGALGAAVDRIANELAVAA